MMTTNSKLEVITSFLDELFPNAKGELIYSKDYELLIAIVLSAQTTDKAVNKVTPILFNKYKSLEELASGDIADIKKIIKSIGLYQNKAKNILLLAKELVSKYESKVPKDYNVLTSLPGVGNKTAGVFLIEYYKIPYFPVDTHVSRTANRLGLVRNITDPNKIEKQLEKLFKIEDYIKLHHQFIHFGRYFCKAKNPHCKNCKLVDICLEKTAKR